MKIKILSVVSEQARLKDRNILKVQLLSFIVYSVFLLVNGLWHLQCPSLRTEEKALVAIFSFAVPGSAFAVISSWYQNPTDFVILLNMILIYERRVFHSRAKDYKIILGYAKFLKFALRLLGLCGSMFIQIFVLLLIIVKAGSPPFLGSIIPGS